MWMAARCGAGFVVLIVSGDGAWAHALAQRYDLPLPLGYFLVAAGAAVAVSFLILGLFWHRASGRKASDQMVLRGRVPSAFVFACQLLGIAGLLLVITAGLFGNPAPFKNITPVAVWVIWWVGCSLLSAFVGNIWPLINPWSAVFGLAEWLARTKRVSRQWRYPRWLGNWPACFLFFTFAWCELVVPQRDVPRNIALGLLTYSILTFAAFIAFGRRTWLQSGEAFSVVFDLFGRFAPIYFTDKDGWQWELRPYGYGLLISQPLTISMTAFALLTLATVTVDGFMETPAWVSVVSAALAGPDGVDTDSGAYLFLQSLLLAAGPLALAVLYFSVILIMARTTASSVAKLAGLFVLSLVPIAIAYYLSHYFSLFMLAGQFIIPLVSDPFGFGWDLFGTTLYRVDIGVVDAKMIWYLAVVAIVTGHIIAVGVGHVTAYTVFEDSATARRSQYPMLMLMVCYTMMSLWIIAQPIVEPGAK